MEFTIDENFLDKSYSIVKREQNGIKIVEINEKDFDKHDFVLIHYIAVSENLVVLEQLYEKYKKSEKTVCFIGCISDDSDFKLDYSEYQKFFDLNGTMISEKEFESIVLSAYSCRGGLTHGDPQDWLNMKSSEDLCCLEETGNSVSEMVEHLYSRFKKHFAENPNNRKMQNGIVSIIGNDAGDISMNDLNSINKLSEFFEEGFNLLLSVNANCEEIAKGKLKLTLI